MLYKKQSKTSASEAFLASLNADYGSKTNPFLTEDAYTTITTAITSILNSISDLEDRQIPIVLVIAAGNNVTWNVRANYNSELTLTASSTLILTNLLPGDYGTIKIIQGGVGSYTLALPAGSLVSDQRAGVITLSTVVGAKDVATFYYDGITLYWAISTNFT